MSSRHTKLISDSDGKAQTMTRLPAPDLKFLLPVLHRSGRAIQIEFNNDGRRTDLNVYRLHHWLL